MQGKVVVITGATSGIGQIAAERLAALGAQNRSGGARPRAGGADARAAAGGGTGGRTPGAYRRSVDDRRGQAGGREIAAAEPRIDVLINNAGNVFANRGVTPDGLERTFAINHMAYFVLTHVLRERLVASAPARMVNTASPAHRGRSLDFTDLQSHRYSVMEAYGRSKLANILFTRELARRLAGTGVTANCLHPGFVATGSASGRAACSAPSRGLPCCSPASRRPARRRSCISPVRRRWPASAAPISPIAGRPNRAPPRRTMPPRNGFGRRARRSPASRRDAGQDQASCSREFKCPDARIKPIDLVLQILHLCLHVRQAPPSSALIISSRSSRCLLMRLSMRREIIRSFCSVKLRMTATSLPMPAFATCAFAR